MRRIAHLCSVSLALLLGGCSVYPLPEDVMPFNSDQIANVIRCQTRDAVRRIVRETAAATGSAIAYDGLTGDKTAAWLENHPEDFRTLKWEKFSPQLRAPFLFYKDTSISYDFTIDTTETNTAGVNLTLLRQLTGGTNNVGLVAKNDRTREVSRHFRSFDTFDSLARLLDPNICRDAPTEINALYPSAGLLRIYSLVRSFLFANQKSNLAGADDAYTTAEMADTLTFTTKFTGNIEPSTTADPIVGKWLPSSASLNIDNSRQDLHTIIILLRLPPSPKGLPDFDAYGRIVAPNRSAQRAAASAALDRQRDINTQNALTRFGTGVGRINN